jgi:arsenite methyltransferase
VRVRQNRVVRPSTLQVLVDPEDGRPLRVVDAARSDDELVAGHLEGPAGRRTYAVRDGIPRMVPADEQAQTQGSFAYKWQRQEAYESEHYLRFIERDEVARWGLARISDFYHFFPTRGLVLEVGCGSAHFASLYVPHLAAEVEWIGMDLSSAIDIARARIRPLKERSDFVQGNIHQMPFAPGTIDHVFARGVLHHTPSTEQAFKACVRLLKPDGAFTFLIYRRMGPIREFTDDHIRAYLSRLEPSEAWRQLESLTKLARALTDARVEITIPEDIPYLELPAGTYDLQRLFYDHIVKAYWSPELDFETNQHNTFDWYHPQFAFHHTEADIRRWCEAAGLEITFIKPLWTSWAVRTVKRTA